MIALNCENLCLSFGTDIILENINFALNGGEKLGIVGINGAGKSSLFKMIAGEYEPTSGAVHIAGYAKIGYLKQNSGIQSDRTILDEAYTAFENLIRTENELHLLSEKIESGNASDSDTQRLSQLTERFTALGGYEFRSRCRGMLKNLGFSEDLWSEPVSSLSGGQKTRLALAVMLLRDPDILMLDEPTNHLDYDTTEWLEGYLKASKKTILVISHDRYFLDNVTTKILEIENRKARLYGGNYTEYAKKRQKDREIEEKHYLNQQKEIARIEAYIEQQKRWNRERNIIAAESRRKQLDKMEKLDRPEAVSDSIKLAFNEAGESGNDVLRAVNLSKSFPGKPLFSDVNFLLKKRDHMFIMGKNGCGKSTLIRILAGKSAPDCGFAEYGFNVKLGYFDQENRNLSPENTVLDELWNAYPNMTRTEIRNTLALFLFRGDDADKKVSVLSGGEAARLSLAKMILSKVNLLILDEPTNHLDIPSREALENALEKFDGTLIAVSHDRYFVNKLATRILDFDTPGTGLLDFDGTYSEYNDYKKRVSQSNDSKIANPTSRDSGEKSSKEIFLASKKANSEQKKLERKIAKAKEDIKKIERRIEEIDEEMSGSAATDASRLIELSEEKDGCEQTLLELYELLDASEEL